MPTQVLYALTVKKMLGIPAGITRYDDAISETLDATEQILLDELNLTDFVTATYSEKIDVISNGLNEVALSHRPIISVAGLTINNQAQTITKNYEINKELGVIKLVPLSASFPTGRSAVDITYTAGWTAIGNIPKDIIYAGHLISCSLFNQQSHVGFVSERAGNYTYNMGKATGSTIPEMASRILNKYRRLFARGLKIQ
tara:strand:+ start:556 stop:1152 length:597 start_codon:yes stop_codon:yes gene_type:complete